MTTATLFLTLLTVGIASVGQVQLGEPPPDPAKARAAAIERAKSHLAQALKVPEKDLAVESAKATTWPDTSLGCPEKGRLYAQVVSSGWTVVLKARGRAHEVHVSGRRAVTCPPKEAAGEERDR